jgi:cardiolipin synthase
VVASNFRTLATALAAILISACATPGVRSHTDNAASPPAVLAAGGALSAVRSERLIDSRLTSAPGAKENTDLDDEHIRELIAAFRDQANAPLVSGNKISLLRDGPQTLAAIRKAIAAAQHHVHVETYIFSDDEIGRAFSELLIERRRAGVEVRVLYDAVGSVTTPGSFFDTMRAAGVEVREFRPLNPVRTPLTWKINNRDHRKIVVVDGRTAFTGGINISSTYASSSAARPGPKSGLDEGWRDTHVEITGPVAAQFQSLFLATWTRAGGAIAKDAPDYFPAIAPAGSEVVAAVAGDGDDAGETAIYATYLTAIQHASQRIWLTNAYFAPNKELRAAMISAAKRGVDVRLIVPGFTDSGLILHASRASFDELLSGGVRIYEQRYALLHAKTAVIDTALSMVGSANLDMRSFLHNNEVNAVIVGTAFARQLEQMFERDLKDTRELKLAEWRKRPLSDKLKELGSSLFSYWL